MHLESRTTREPVERAFDATLRLTRRPLTRRSLASIVVRYPPQTLRIVAGIYGARRCGSSSREPRTTGDRSR